MNHSRRIHSPTRQRPRLSARQAAGHRPAVEAAEGPGGRRAAGRSSDWSASGRLGYGSNHLVMPIAAARPAGPHETPPKSANGRLSWACFSGRRRASASSASPATKPRPAQTEGHLHSRPTAPATPPPATWCWCELSQPRHGEPGPRGEIVEIVERQTHQFVGTYFESAGAAYVRIDGTLFARPIYVGDPGAKNARPDDKVVIEMVRFPSPLHDGEGVITEVLGPRGKPGVDTLSIIREFNLPEQFRRRRAGRSPRAGRDVRRGDRRPDRLHRRDDRDDRPGRRAGFRRRDLAGAARQRPLAAGRPHRRRVALRPAQHGAGPRGPGAGHERLSARPRAAHAARGDLQRPGEPSAGQGPLHQVGRHGVHGRGPASLRPSCTRRPSAAASGSPTSRSTSSWPTTRRPAPQAGRQGLRPARAGCTRWP